MSAEKVYKELTNGQLKLDKEGMSGFVGSLVRRVRDKLGDEAIITKPGEDYIARNRLIRKQVEENRNGKQEERGDKVEA